MPGIVLKALYILTHLILMIAPWGEYFYGPHFKDMDTPMQRG